MVLSFRLSLATLFIALLAAWLGTAAAIAADPKFTSFEARQTHSLALTPDGTRLLALNSVAASLSVFDATTATPTLLAEIPVGLEPVAVRARTNDEAWVVSEVGDSVAIVSLSRKTVVSTLTVGDEPGDLVFASGKAFVTCARDRVVYVFDAASKQALPSIPLAGMDPRALAVNAAGTKIYAAFLHSGNQTTILERHQAPPQPVPSNSNLSEGPNVALIVPANDSRIPFTLLDRDVAEIDVASGAVTYFSGAGTTLFDVAVNPANGQVWVANTEALNLIHFESNLRGHFVDSRLTRLQPANGAKDIFDLNAGTDYSVLPNPAARAINLAQPTGLTFTPDGSALWMAAFGTDRVAKISPTTGQVVLRVDVRTGGGTSSAMRGPRALVLHPSQPRLFVLNKLSDSLTTISTDAGTVVSEVPLSAKDTMPAALRQGRGFLFDARLSGNATVSCASCHIDADRDGMAWDLGDQEGDEFLLYGYNKARDHDTVRLQPRQMHPLKGAMVTQTLRSMLDGAPFHWRGDRPAIQSFNVTFAALLGGTQIDGADMDKLAAYLLSLRNHPNPNRSRTNALPTSFQGGNPVQGEKLFKLAANHCNDCHTIPLGSDRNIDDKGEIDSSQFIKNPPLATTYQRLVFNPTAGGQTLTGFGLLHDGTGSVLPTVHAYTNDELSKGTVEESLANFRDVAAFVMCFETGTMPVVGESLTVTSTNASAAAATLSRLEALTVDAGDLVATGVLNGVTKRFTYSRALKLYLPDDSSMAPMTRAFLLDGLGASGVLTFKAVPPGEGARFGGAQNLAVAAAPDSFFTKSTKSALKVKSELSVLKNDPGTTLGTDTVTTVSAPANGTLALNADSSFSYLPSVGFAASQLDSFDYRIQVNKSTTNTVGPVSATVSTYAKAAGKYLGHVETGSDAKAAGYVTVSVTSTGMFSGAVTLGTQRLAIKGKVEANGNLKISGKTAFAVALQLHAWKTGERNVTATLTNATTTAVGTLLQVPFSKANPVPNPGKYALTLTPAAVQGEGPTTPGSLTLVVSKTDSAKLTGKLGDGTAISFAGGLSANGAGGWRFDVFTKAYKYPAGPVSGELVYDGTAITGTIRVVEPPQTKKSAYPNGFTIDYKVSAAL